MTRPYLLEAIRAGRFAPEWLFLGPSLFLILFLISLIPNFVQDAPVRLLGHDYLRLLFALFVVFLSFPASIREYKARKIKEPVSTLVKMLAQDKDARIRALALMASAPHIFSHPDFLALIHQGLLDKDPLVRQAAPGLTHWKFVKNESLGPGNPTNKSSRGSEFGIYERKLNP